MDCHTGFVTAQDRTVAAFNHTFGEPPQVVARAPGRVNLIGEHTDYNKGFVLPMALPFDTVIAASRIGGDSTMEVHSEGFGQARFALCDDPAGTVSWARYVHGTGVMLAGAGHDIGPWRGTIATDIPAGASLSSSAALEIAAALAFCALAGVSVEPTDLARIGQRVENEIMGLPSGMLDQLASIGSVDGHATLIDCADLSITSVPFPDDAMIVVLDTGTRRELVESAYADRQASCATAAEMLGYDSLREADMDDVRRLDDPVLQARTRHVVTENARTLAAAKALQADDLPALGVLMNGSHHSLRYDYEVSGPALDAICEVARTCTGCFGARMTGGGFAGGAIALVAANAVGAFCDELMERYEPPAEQPAVAPVRLYPTVPSAGAGMIT